ALDFIVAFMFSALACEMAGVNLAMALLPAVFYAAVQLGRQCVNSSVVKAFQGREDNLDQRLQTAMEYQGTKNIIVEDLMSDVTKRMDAVETSTFLNSKELSRRIMTIVVLSFILLTVTVLNLRSVAFDSLNYLMDTANLRDGVKDLAGMAGTGFEVVTGDRWEASNFSTDKSQDKLGAKPGGTNPGVSQGPVPGKGSGTGDTAKKNIYGDAKSANIAGQDVDFKLHPEYGGDIEIRETGTQKQVRAPSTEEVLSVDECQDCTVGPEHEEMVRKYFEKILPAG
ncbi:MAG: hypothetical protein V1875_10255, partial [Candidatus Altiarchaeota archaeon]